MHVGKSRVQISSASTTCWKIRMSSCWPTLSTEVHDNSTTLVCTPCAWESVADRRNNTLLHGRVRQFVLPCMLGHRHTTIFFPFFFLVFVTVTIYIYTRLNEANFKFNSWYKLLRSAEFEFPWGYTMVLSLCLSLSVSLCLSLSSLAHCPPRSLLSSSTDPPRHGVVLCKARAHARSFSDSLFGADDGADFFETY